MDYLFKKIEQISGLLKGRGSLLEVNVRVRYKWWKFWLPKTVKHVCGTYTKIGNKVFVACRLGTYVVSEPPEGLTITGLPYKRRTNVI